MRTYPYMLPLTHTDENIYFGVSFFVEGLRCTWLMSLFLGGHGKREDAPYPRIYGCLFHEKYSFYLGRKKNKKKPIETPQSLYIRENV